LINPSKSELGKVTKILLEKINKVVRESTSLNQRRNTNTVIEWFQNINNKNNATFIQFDIVDFYPSITKDLLTDSINHAKKFTDISDHDINLIMHVRESLNFYRK